MDEKLTNTTTTGAKAKRWSVIALGGLAVVLLSAPLTGYAASAALDDGNFLMRTTDQSGFVGQAGMRLSEIESPTPTPTAPAAETTSIRQNLTFVLQDKKYADVSYTIRYRWSGGEWIEFEGKASSTGYADYYLMRDRTVDAGTPFQADSLEIEMETSAGERLRWQLGTDRFRADTPRNELDENGSWIFDENGDPVLEDQIELGGEWFDATFSGTTMLHFVHGAWPRGWEPTIW